MPKVEKKIVLSPTEIPYMLKASYPFSPVLNAAFKVFPGVRFDGIKKRWLVPKELAREITKIGEGYKLKVDVRPEKRMGLPFRPNGKLFDYQLKAESRSLYDWAHLLNFEMGLGKTPTAIDTIKNSKATHSLIVTPSIVKGTWEDELATWWKSRPDVLTIHKGSDWEKYKEQYGIVITSYGLIDGAVGYNWASIILDESHHIKNRNAARTKKVIGLRNANRDALALCLSATPITDRIEDLWQQLDFLFPGRFGSYWQFCRRYILIEQNKYTKFALCGLNPEFSDELRSRVASISSQVSRADVGDKLPPINTQLVRIRPKHVKKWRELCDKWTGRLDLHKANLDAFLSSAKDLKIDPAVELANEIREASGEQVAVITYHVDTAEEIARKLGVTAITGQLTPRKRKALIDRSLSEKGLIVASMKSIGIGINNLANVPNPILAELYYSPDVIIQTIGRFSRISTKRPTTLRIITIEGTLDEIIARTLQEKLRDIAAVLKAGGAGGALGIALEDAEASEEDFITRLKDVAEGFAGDDEYI